MGYLYIITNNINNKQYIGITQRTIEQRWHEHCISKRDLVIDRAILKYGENNFTINSICEYTNSDDLYKAEILSIEYYNTFVPNGYNVSKGGESNYGYKHTENTKQKLSSLGIGHKRNIKLDQELVNEIRKLYKETSLTQKEIAEAINLDKSTIQHIVRGKSWTDGNYRNTETKSKLPTKLTQDQVNDIRKLYAETNYSMRNLGEMYNVTYGTIRKIVNNLTWKQ